MFNFLQVQYPDSSLLIRDVTEMDKRAYKELPDDTKDMYSNAVDNNDFDDLSKEKIYNLLCEYSVVNTVMPLLKMI